MARPRSFDETQILEKAANLFWEKGYAQTSMQDLVDHLGINRASLYNAFTDKDHLYIEALSHYQQVNQKALRDLFKLEDDVKKGIKMMMINSLYNSSKPKGCMVVNCTVEMYHQKIFFDFLRQNRSAFNRLMKAYLKKGIDSGQLKKELDITSVSNYLFTFFSGLNVMTKLDPSKKEVERTIDLALTILD